MRREFAKLLLLKLVFEGVRWPPLYKFISLCFVKVFLRTCLYGFTPFTSDRRWDTTGMQLISTENNSVVCQSRHLTYFAIIMVGMSLFQLITISFTQYFKRHQENTILQINEINTKCRARLTLPPPASAWWKQKTKRNCYCWFRLLQTKGKCVYILKIDCGCSP